MSIEKKTTLSVYISIQSGLTHKELEELREVLSENSIQEITCQSDEDGVTLNFILE